MMKLLRKGGKRRAAFVAAVSLGAFQALTIVGAGSASAVLPGDCTYNPSNDTVTVQMQLNEDATIGVVDETPGGAADEIQITAGASGAQDCGSAQVSNTVLVVVLGSGATVGAETFTVDNDVDGSFGVIGFSVDMGNGADLFEWFGTADDDTVTLTNSTFVANGGNGELVGVEQVFFDLNDGNDTFDGSGSTAGIGVVDDTPLPPDCNPPGDVGVFGDDGDDTITGGSGDDCLDGWIGDDTVSGGAGNDVVFGFSGDDTLSGGADSDTVVGEADDDVIDEGSAPSAPDFLRGNTGVDELNYGARTTSTAINMTTGICGEDANADGDAADTGDENDDCDSDFEVLVTGSGNDSLIGDGTSEFFLGQGGNDVVDGNGGFNTNSWSTSAGPITVDSAAGTATGDGDDSWTDIDELDGSPATNDLLDFSGETGPVTANLCTSAFTGTSSFTDVTVANAGLVNCTATFENLTGSPGNDNLTGDAQQNKLIGGLGSDAFTGLGGADTVSFKNSANGVEVDLSLGFAEGEGSDSFPGGLGDIEIIVGSNFDDTITGGLTTGGGSINFRFKGLKGDDSLTGSASNDTLLGGGGSDVMRSGQGDDTLKGAGGNDMLAGGGGFDIGNGGKGKDVCSSIEQKSSCGTKKKPAAPQSAVGRLD